MSYTEYFDLIMRAKASNAPYVLYTLDGVGAERKYKAFDFYTKSQQLMHKMLNKFLQLEKQLGKKIIVKDNIIKLLAHKTQIIKLKNKSSQKGLTIVPTKMYFSGSNVKVEIALAKGKQLFDKKNTIKEKDQTRDLDNYLKNKKYV